MAAQCKRCGNPLTAANWSPGMKRVGRKICQDCWRSQRGSGGHPAAAEKNGVSTALMDYRALVDELRVKRDAWAAEVEKLDLAIAAIEALG